MTDVTSGESSGSNKPTADGYVKNQSGVTRETKVSADGTEITITLSANLNDMDKWESSVTAQNTGGASHWYVIVLDSGVAYKDWYENPNHNTGTRVVAVTNNNAKPTSKDSDLITYNDVKDATAFSGHIFEEDPVVGVPLWINMDQLESKGSFNPIQFYVRDKDATEWGDPYLTIKIVKGTITKAEP